ncbi:MAG: hypothetical protein ACYS9X_31650 [Planctomycetota bacterium]
MPCIIAVFLLAGCGRSASRLSSPDEVIAAFQQYRVKADAQELWTLFGAQQRARFPGGTDDLKGALATRRVQHVAVRDKIVDGDSVIYYLTTTYSWNDPVMKGTSISSRVMVSKENNHWRIARIIPDRQ